MRTTGEFTIHEYKIETKLNEPIYIMPFGDVHRSAPGCEVDRWHEFLERAAEKPRTFFLGMGDYDDLASTSERRLLLDPDLHESTVETLEEIYMKNVWRLAEEMKFMKGRIIGLLEGNHFGQFSTGITTTQKLCDILQAPYLGCNSFIRLSFKCKTQNHARTSVDIFAHHGRGGGRTEGGNMNPVQQMGDIAEADIYLMGDNHQKAVAVRSKLRLRHGGTSLKLSQRKVILARTGSFLKSYVPNKRNYIVDKNLPPSDLGTVELELTLKRDRKEDEDRLYVDLNAMV